MSQNTNVTESTTESTTEINTEDMSTTLEAAGKTAEAEKRKRRERVVKGSHLVETLTSKAAGRGLTVTENQSFFKVTGATKGKAIYVAKKGGRADLSGFTVDQSAVLQISAEFAKEKHMGKVQGQLNFDAPDADVLAAYEQALVVLETSAPAPGDGAE